MGLKFQMKFEVSDNFDLEETVQGRFYVVAPQIHLLPPDSKDHSDVSSEVSKCSQNAPNSFRGSAPRPRSLPPLKNPPPLSGLRVSGTFVRI